MAPLDPYDKYTIVFYANKSVVVFDNNPNVTTNYVVNSTQLSVSSLFSEFNFRFNKFVIGLD